MARAGRPAKPDYLKILAGNPGKRSAAARTKKAATKRPVTERPPRPAWLDDEARREWNRIVRLLIADDRIQKIDRALLASYCVTWSRWVAVEAKIARLCDHEWTKTTDSGYVIVHPLLSTSQKLAKDLRMIANEFGLSPSARGRLPQAPQADTEDDYGEFKKGRTG